MNLVLRHTLVLFLITSLAGCLGEEDEASQLLISSMAAESIESSLNSVSGILDDLSNESMVTNNTSINKSPLSFIIPEAHANTVTCDRSLSGLSGSCSRDVNCESGVYSWTGVASFNFSNGSSCMLTGAGDSVTRTVDFVRTGPLGNLTTSGSMTLDQVGTSDYDLSVSDYRKVLRTSGGANVFDVTVFTDQGSPISISGLGRGARTINGALKVNHNFLNATYTKNFSNVQYESTCCYPTTGTIEGSWDGAIGGSYTASFTGTCGEVELTVNESTSIHALSYCE